MPCEDFVHEAEEALKRPMFGKSNPELAAHKYEEAAKCYKKNNDFKTALRVLGYAAKLRLDMGDTFMAALDFEELGILAKMLKEPHQDFFLTAAASYRRVAESLSGNSLKSSEMYSKVAECFIEAGQCEDAAQVYLSSAELSLKTDNYMRAIVNLAGAMNCYDIEKNYARAREISEQVSEIWLRQGIFEKAMESFGKTAYYLAKLGDLNAALNSHLNAAEAAKKQPNRRFLARCYEDVGRSYLTLHNMKKAGYHYFLAGEEYIAVGSKPSAIENYQKASDAYIEASAPKNAVTCLLKMAQVQRSEKNLSAAEPCYLKSADLLEQEGDIEPAEIVLTQRAEMWEGASDFFNSARAYEDIAQFCERNGKDSKKYHEKAASYHFLNAEKLAKIKNVVLSRKEYEYAGICFEKMGNLDRAIECYKNSDNLGEYNRLASKMGIFETRTAEDTERRLQKIEIELQEIEKDRRGNMLAEEEFQMLKKIYLSLKGKLEEKLKW